MLRREVASRAAKSIRGLMIAETALFLCAAAYFAGLNLLHVWEQRPHMNFHYDFGFFYWAFAAVWHGHAGTLLYNQALVQKWMSSLGYPVYAGNQYVYPPQFAVLFSWLAAVPYRAASFVWLALALAGYALCIYWLGRLCFPRVHFPSGDRLPVLFLVAICVANDGFYSDLTIGNVTWLLLMLVCAAFYLRYGKGRGFLAGILLGLAAVIKVTPAILLPYYLLRREWRMVYGMLTGIGLSTVMTVAAVGWRPVWGFAAHFRQLLHGSMQSGSAPHNLSIQGVLVWITNVVWPHFGAHGGVQSGVHLGSKLAGSLFIVVIVLLALAVVWLSVRGRLSDPHADMAMAALCLIIFSPLVEGTHLLLLVVTAVMTFSIWWSRHMEEGSSLSLGAAGGGSLLWFGVFCVSVLLLSVTREVLEGMMNGFPLLIVGWMGIAAATFLLLARRTASGG